MDSKQFGLIGLILVLKYSLVNGLCNFPCNWQNKRYFGISDGSDNTITCQQSSLNTAITSEDQTVTEECYAQSGPFKVLRLQNTNRYFCLKDTFFDKNADIIFIYITPTRTYKQSPSICDVCYGFQLKPSLYVSDNVQMNKYDTMKLKYSAIGCNRPKNCPAEKQGDFQCTGCEEASDNGLCCSQCKTRQFTY